MQRNHNQVIKLYREISREMKALGVYDYLHNEFFYYQISLQVDYEPEVIGKIIRKYKKTEEWKWYQKFLNTLPCIYPQIKHKIIHFMINCKLNEVEH